MPDTAILDEILKTLRRDKKKRLGWPDHIMAQAGIVVKEASLLLEAADDLKYGKDLTVEHKAEKIKDLEAAAIQTAASAIRFLENLKK